MRLPAPLRSPAAAAPSRTRMGERRLDLRKTQALSLWHAEMDEKQRADTNKRKNDEHRAPSDGVHQ